MSNVKLYFFKKMCKIYNSYFENNDLQYKTSPHEVVTVGIGQ